MLLDIYKQNNIMIKDAPVLFDENARAKETFTFEDLCVTQFFHSQKTLNDICTKYQFKDIEDLQRFCHNILNLIHYMNVQQDAILSLCNSDVVEYLVKQGRITVKDING